MASRKRNNDVNFGRWHGEVNRCETNERLQFTFSFDNDSILHSAVVYIGLFLPWTWCNNQALLHTNLAAMQQNHADCTTLRILNTTTIRHLASYAGNENVTRLQVSKSVTWPMTELTDLGLSENNKKLNSCREAAGTSYQLNILLSRIPEETTINSLIFRFIMICVNIFLLHVMLIFGIACLIQLLMLAL